MTDPQDKIKLFESQQVRSDWDAENEKWWFSVVDVIEILSNQPSHDRARKYWSVMKTRMKQEGAQLTTICSQLRLQAPDGKKWRRQIFRKCAIPKASPKVRR